MVAPHPRFAPGVFFRLQKVLAQFVTYLYSLKVLTFTENWPIHKKQRNQFASPPTPTICGKQVRVHNFLECGCDAALDV